MAYELEEPLAALASSSARHSEMDLTLWKADSRVYVRGKGRIHELERLPDRSDSGTQTYTDGQEGDGLVDPPEGRDIDGLSPDGSLGTDSGRVLSGTGVDDGVNQDLHVSPKSANFVPGLASCALAQNRAPGWGSGRSTSG
jgi:hypothetical protein